MAGLTKQRDTQYWQAVYYDGAGVKVRRSTKETDRRKALETAMSWEKLAKAGRQKRLTESQARKVVGEILERATGETLHFYTCRQWFDEWLASKRGSVGERSIVRYKQV